MLSGTSVEESGGESAGRPRKPDAIPGWQPGSPAAIFVAAVRPTHDKLTQDNDAGNSPPTETLSAARSGAHPPTQALSLTPSSASTSACRTRMEVPGDPSILILTQPVKFWPKSMIWRPEA
jgi:hypothetical protein